MQIHNANNDADSAILALLAGGSMYLFHAASAFFHAREPLGLGDHDVVFYPVFFFLYQSSFRFSFFSCFLQEFVGTAPSVLFLNFSLALRRC